ncbi:hypothetical protein HDU97_002503 [Phlyctochytrium planicorne]|nr:hypothetical protein HDU97_002503 [Phlyctochytrium planicorne]
MAQNHMPKRRKDLPPIPHQHHHYHHSQVQVPANPGLGAADLDYIIAAYTASWGPRETPMKPTIPRHHLPSKGLQPSTKCRQMLAPTPVYIPPKPHHLFPMNRYRGQVHQAEDITYELDFIQEASNSRPLSPVNGRTPVTTRSTDQPSTSQNQQQSSQTHPMEMQTIGGGVPDESTDIQTRDSNFGCWPKRHSRRHSYGPPEPPASTPTFPKPKTLKDYLIIIGLTILLIASAVVGAYFMSGGWAKLFGNKSGQSSGNGSPSTPIDPHLNDRRVTLQMDVGGEDEAPLVLGLVYPDVISPGPLGSGEKKSVFGSKTVYSEGNIGMYVIPKLPDGSNATSGVTAIHAGVMVGTNKVVFVERWDIHGTAVKAGNITAWSTEYDIETNTFRPLSLLSNVFCGAGALLPDGRLMVIGGAEAHDSMMGPNGRVPAILDGEKAVRFIKPSTSPTGTFGKEDWLDIPNADKVSLLEERWYPTVLSLPDGRVIIIGGTNQGVQFNSNASFNVPSVEFLPKPSDTSPILPFLRDTLPVNLYGVSAVMPSGHIFLFLSNRSTLLDPSDTYTELNHFVLGIEDPVKEGDTAKTCISVTSSSVWSAMTKSANVSVPTAINDDDDTVPVSQEKLQSALGTSVVTCTASDSNSPAWRSQLFSFFRRYHDVAVSNTTQIPFQKAGIIFNAFSRMCLAAMKTNAGYHAGFLPCDRDDFHQLFEISSNPDGRTVFIKSVLQKVGCLSSAGITGPTIHFATCKKDSKQTQIESQSFSRVVISAYVQGGYFEYPQLAPGPFRSYPLTGFGAMLPLDPSQSYEPTMIVCGGSDNLSMQNASGKINPIFESAYARALDSCGTIRPERPSEDWKGEKDPMPTGGRVMGDFVLLPDGTALVVNGAGAGMAGWDKGRNPQTTALLYLPNNDDGDKWRVLNSTTIARLYHSVAFLLPDGRVMIGGSAPNAASETIVGAAFQNEVTVEYYIPHYLMHPDGAPSRRPAIILPQNLSKTSTKASELTGWREPWQYNTSRAFTIRIPKDKEDAASDPVRLQFSLLHTGFRTHSTGMSERHIWLRSLLITDVMIAPTLNMTERPGTKRGNSGALVTRQSSENDEYVDVKVAVESPWMPTVAPPSWYMLFAVLDGIPSIARWVQIGSDPAGMGVYGANFKL